MNSCNAPDRLSPLPVRPRPLAGEPAGTYIRRLARANHLRPSYLHGYLAGPPTYLGPIQPERLAALSGRTLTVLERTLTGLTWQTADTPRQPLQPSRHRIRAAGIAGLIAAIRRDAQTGSSIQTLATRHRVHPRIIRQALADPSPPSPGHPPHRITALDPIHDPITVLLASDPLLTARQIWERLVDDHGADITFACVSYHVINHHRPHGHHTRRHRKPTPAGKID